MKSISLLILLLMIFLTLGIASASEDIGELAVDDVASEDVSELAVDDVASEDIDEPLVDDVSDSVDTVITDESDENAVEIEEDQNLDDSNLRDEEKIVDANKKNSLSSSSDDAILGDKQDFDFKFAFSKQIRIGAYYTTVVVGLPIDAKGNLAFYIDGKNVFQTTISGYQYQYDFDIGGVALSQIGTHTIKANYWGDANYVDKNKSGSFEVVYNYFACPAEDYLVGMGEAAIYFVAQDDVKGFITLLVDGKEYETYFAEHRTRIDLSQLPFGKHNYEVKYSGDGKYKPISQKGVINLYDYYTDLGHLTNGVFGEKSKIYLQIPYDLTGDVILRINGKEYVKTIDSPGNTIIFSVSDLAFGENDYSIEIQGDKKYPSKIINSTTPINITRYGIFTDIDENNSKVSYNLTLPNDATGKLIVIIDGNYSKNITLVDGKASFLISDYYDDLGFGNHDVLLNYTGNYENISHATDGFTIGPKVSFPETFYLGDIININIDFPLDFEGNITYYTDKEYNEEISSPTKQINITAKVPGSFYFSFNCTLKNGTKFWPIDYSFDLSPRYVIPTGFIAGEDKKVTLDCGQGFNGYCCISIWNGFKEYYATVPIKDGKLSYSLSKIPAGEWLIGLGPCDKDGNSLDSMSSGYWLLIDDNFLIKGKTVSPSFNLPSGNVARFFDMNLPSKANGGIIVAVDGVSKLYFQVINGKATIDLSSLSLGKHQLSIKYSGDETYAGFVKALTVTVPDKYKTAITAPKVKATYYVNKKLVITLKSNGKVLANKKVTIKVGTISKTVTTDSKGKASVYVHKLVPKTYTATIKFAGDKHYKASSLKVKVIVKKATPKIVASKKTFKASKKVKKVTAKMKNKKGKILKSKKLTLTINKKKYKVKTNKKGIATFKIKLTKKGKFIGKIKFAGDKYYKALTKKVTVVIK